MALMEIDQSRIDDLVARPSESLNVEIKRWIDPAEPEGQAKIIKAAFAIRNRNGGFLLIGFDDKTLLPDRTSALSDVQTAFHLDMIQGLVSRYASEPFEIAVGFGTRDGQKYPVVGVPEGVRTPVAVKRDLLDSKNSNRVLVKEGDIYFRTLASNGTPSSAAARASDWADIIEICFENREADIGRFLRRHISGKDITSLVEALNGFTAPAAPPPPTLKARAHSLLAEGEEKLRAAIRSLQLTPEKTDFLNGLAWSVALVIDPAKSDAICNKDFLSTVMGANPQYSGWPVWLDSRNFHDQAAHPHVIDNAWQAFIVSEKGWTAHADFMRLDPRGEFYLWRLLQDDLTNQVRPGTVLDGVLVLIRVAEAIAAGLSIAKGLGWGEGARLGFAFRWAKLKGRELASWANPLVTVRPGHTAYSEDVETFVEMPLETPLSAIAPYVEEATRELFALFDGYIMPSEAAEYWAKKLVERKL